MATILTTRGDVDESQLARTVGFEDRPTEFVVWVEYRIDNELVRRDCHVILKQAAVQSDLTAASFG